MAQLPELMTAGEVATVLRWSVETVHRKARLGELPSINVLGSRRFRRHEIEALLADQTTPDEQPAEVAS